MIKKRRSLLLTVILFVVFPSLAIGADLPNKQRAKGSPQPLETKQSIAMQTTRPSRRPSYVEGEVLVKFKRGKINVDQPYDTYALTFWYNVKFVHEKARLKPQNVVLLRSGTKTTDELIRALKNDPFVEYVEPNYLYTATATTPNDASFANLWGLNNTGQIVNGTAGTSDADIDAPEAWDLQSTASGVTVAVIDSGVNLVHPDLAASIVTGYDFVDSDTSPYDLNGHGTHVAGTIGAIGNNSQGVTGVAWNPKIMPVRVLNANGSGTNENIAAGVTYAVQNGAQVINMSLGGTAYSQTLYDAINIARTAGVLVVVASGNDGYNNDGGTHHYPCDYGLDNILCVAASGQTDALASFSNYGTTSVDVAAPGVNIYSTYPGQALVESFDGASNPTIYGYDFTGTSFTQSGDSPPDGWIITDVAGDKWAESTYGFPGNNIDTYITSSVIDTSGRPAIILKFTYDFWTETSPTANCEYDYLGVDLDNGSTWTEIGRLCNYGSIITEQAGTISVDISAYASAGMRVRFLWHTNSSGGSYPFFLNDVKVLDTREGYTYLQGTSMASPQVAGLAALLKSYKATFTYLGIKNTILNNVDTKAGLAGKVVTGGRINAFNSLSNVDVTAPTATLNYSTTAPTNQNVTATLAPSESIIVSNNGGSASYTFTANGSFGFTFTDLAGNAGTATATVSNIDKTAPVVTIASYTTTPTNQDITVTATTNEGTLNAASHTFTVNGSFDFVATDAAGNSTTSTVTITNIDKTPPVITIAPYTTAATRSDITVTATTNEGTLNAASHTFTANGSFDFVATDAAGNSTTSTVTITNIDKSAPTIKTIKLTKGVYSYKLNGKTIKISPFGTDYKGAVWARSIDFGPDGKIYVFLNSAAYKKGQIRVFKADGKLLKAYKPYGGFSTSGLNATAVVESNKKVYLAVGMLKTGTVVKTYEVTAAKLTARNSVVATAKAGTILVSFKKLYKIQYGLVTMKQGDKTTIKVWKLDLVKNKFVEDKKINKTKISL
ncbi:MAG: S8 family serine peptidase [Candidatus Kerfeldbacteria bacterium]